MPLFEVIEHTADIGVRAFGTTESEVFQNTAFGMFSLIAELDHVADSTCLKIKVSAVDIENLLVEWLNELIYLYDSQEILLRRFEISRLDDSSLEALAYGEAIDRQRHVLITDIKAATYHMLRVKQKPGGWTAEVIFDV